MINQIKTLSYYPDLVLSDKYLKVNLKLKESKIFDENVYVLLEFFFKYNKTSLVLTIKLF